MLTIDTTNMCSHLQKKLFEEDGIYHSLWLAMQDDSELTAVVRSRQLHIYRNGKKVLVLAGKSAPKIIREDSICELLQIERIKWMEQRFDKTLTAIKDKSADSLNAIKEDVAELSKYYGSELRNTRDWSLSRIILYG
jgi:fructose-1-phosphate kinase PfkB-like protein